MTKHIFIILFSSFLFSQTTPPVILWEQTYEEYYNNISSLIKTTDDGYLFLGCNNNCNNNLLVVKINSEGDITWTFPVIGVVHTSDEYANTLAIVYQPLESKYFYIVNNCNGNYSTYSLIEFNENGITTNMYCLPQGYTYKSFIATSDGGFLAYSHENVLIKFNAQKTIDWTYSFPSNNINYLMKETSDGNFLISGMFELLLADNQTNSYAAKINPQGNLIWEINYGNEQNEFPFSIGEYSDGNFFLVVNRVSTGNLDESIWLNKIDINGNLLSDNLIINQRNISETKVIIEPDDSLIIGYRCSNENCVYNYTDLMSKLTKVNNNNSIDWDIEINHGQLKSILKTSDNNYVAQLSGILTNPMIVKIGWEPLSTPSFENSVSLYPNPAQDFITIKNNFSENQTVVIYNVAGQTIMKQEINQNENSLDVAQLANGIYFVHLPESNTTLKWIKE